MALSLLCKTDTESPGASGAARVHVSGVQEGARRMQCSFGRRWRHARRQKRVLEMAPGGDGPWL